MILWSRWKFLLNLLELTLVPMNSDGETCCKNTKQQFEQLSDDQKLSKLCSNAGSVKLSKEDNISSHLMQKDRSGMIHLCRENTLPRNDPRTRARGWIRRNTKIGPVLNIHDCHHEDRYSIEFMSNLCFKTEPPLGFEL